MTRSVDGVDRALTKFRQARAEIAIHRHAINQPDNDEVKPNPFALPGDVIRMRGIPVIGRGISGGILGTRPDNACK